MKSLRTHEPAVQAPTLDHMLMFQEPLIKAMLQSALVIALWYVGYALFNPDVMVRRLIIGGSMSVISLAGMLAVRMGHIRLGASTVVGASWLVVFWASVTDGGISSYAFVGFFIPIIISGVLFSWKVSFATTAASILVGLGFVLFPALPHGPLAMTHRPVSLFNITSGFFILAWVIMFGVGKSIRGALRKAEERLREKEEVEQALRQSDLLYRRAIETIGAVPYADTLHPRSYSFMGEGIRELTGYSAGEMTPALWRSLVQETIPLGEAEGVPLDEALKRAEQGELKVWKCDSLIRTREGKLKWVADSAIQIMDDEKGQKRSIGILQDVTDRKNVEAVLRQSEEKYRLLAENVSDVIWTTDLSLTLTYISPSIEKLLGWKPEEMLKMSLSDYMTPESVEQALSTLSRELALALSGQRPPDRVDRLELEQVRKDGKTFWTELTVRFYAEPSGRLAGLIGVTRDISERKHAELHRTKLEEQLVQAVKMESVGRLAGGIAHDFNNMLTPIIGYADMLKYSQSLTEAERRMATQILAAAVKSRDLVVQLLAFARKQTLEMRPLNLNSVVGDMKQILRRTVPENIQINYALIPHAPAVKADAGQVAQILMNLAVNAMDAMPDGGTITVETQLASVDEPMAEAHDEALPGEYVVLSLGDTGTGIEREIVSKIFEPFFTTKRAGKGTGLGLSTVYGIARQHGGFVSVDSLVGKGTIFRVYFPATDSPALAEPSGSQGVPTVPGNGTILVVEDQEQVRAMVAESLETQGFSVLEAPDVGTAVAAAGKLTDESIRLLVTDVILPDGDGKMLFERLAPNIPGLRVLYMSGYTAEIIHKDGKLDESVHFLQKPFSTKQLFEKVREALEDTGRSV